MLEIIAGRRQKFSEITFNSLWERGDDEKFVILVCDKKCIILEWVWKRHERSKTAWEREERRKEIFLRKTRTWDICQKKIISRRSTVIFNNESVERYVTNMTKVWIQDQQFLPKFALYRIFVLFLNKMLVGDRVSSLCDDIIFRM